MNAAHIFPYSAGQEAMGNPFGRIKCRSEVLDTISIFINLEDVDKSHDLWRHALEDVGRVDQRTSTGADAMVQGIRPR